MLKIEGKINKRLPTKRFYLPGIKLKSLCPNCGDEIERDMENGYLEYPKVGKVIEKYFYCDDCNEEWYEKIILKVELVTVEEPKNA